MLLFLLASASLAPRRDTFLMRGAEVDVIAKTQSEERFPYEVYDTSPPCKIIGVFSLPPIGCGDILKVNDDAYVVKRVASRFKYTAGRFLLESKRADATEMSREADERRLNRLISADDET